MGSNISCTNKIETFLHCERCYQELPEGQSMEKWARLEMGYTTIGIQIWCLRHNCNVIHVDFAGRKFDANTRWLDAV